MINREEYFRDTADFDMVLEVLGVDGLGTGSNTPKTMNVPGPGSHAQNNGYMTLTGFLNEPSRQAPKRRDSDNLQTQDNIASEISHIASKLKLKTLKPDQLAALNRVLDDIKRITANIG